MLIESPEKSHTLRICLLLVVIVAGGLLRYAYNEVTMDDGLTRGDSKFYVMYAQNILEYSTFSKDRTTVPPIPDSYWAPGYPAFLAALIKLSEVMNLSPPEVVRHTQLLLGVLTIVFTYFVAAAFLPSFWPLLPAVFVAISPHLVAVGYNVLTETLFGFLLIASLYVYIKALSTSGRFLMLLAGTCMAFAWLVNPVSIFLAPILALVSFMIRERAFPPDRAPTWGRLVLVVIPLAIVVTAWGVRTAISVPEGTENSSGRLMTNLIIGLHEDYHGLWRDSFEQGGDPTTKDFETIGTSFPVFAKVLFERIRERPKEMLAWYLLKKPATLWAWNVQSGYEDIYIYPVVYSIYHKSSLALVSYSLMYTLHGPLLLCAILGFILIFVDRRKKSWMPLSTYCLAIYISLVYVVTQADPRYSFPLRPELYLCATYFLYRLVRLGKKYMDESRQ